MTLASGTRLGPYEIIAKLGEGGMGVVFRAKDSQLGREVALKVLPETFTAEPERTARFEREAKLLASLNHPNIAQIYGLETSGDTRALVMELVEGPTLADRLESGALPLDESLSIARQIAEALEEAHEKGIIHRDLKPQNIKASIQGKVKVLDFGLAKALDPSTGIGPSASQLAASPTLTLGATAQGVILGTAAYMSPEQAKGFTVDKRADIWAFGVVLYEMLTGISPFIGDSVPDTLARVLQREIDFSALPESTPPAIRRLLRRCLERVPKRRLHDIADVRLVLDDVIAGVDIEAGPESGISAPSRPPARLHLAWFAALLIAVTGTGLLVRRGGESGAQTPEPQRFAIQLALDQELSSGGNSLLTFSPDGRSLIFSAVVNGRRALYRRPLDERQAKMISGTEDGEAPFLSPDERWMGFQANGELWKVPADGGRAIRIGEARGAGGATWLADGSIVVAPMYSDGLFRTTAEGGELQRLTTPDRDAGVLGHWWPEELPGGRWVLFTAFRTPVDTSRIGVVDLASREVRWLVDGGFFPHYSPTGHLLYAKEQRLFAVTFDAKTATVRGAPVTVLDDVLVEQTGGFAAYALSRRGTLAYVTESLGHAARELVWIDRQGQTAPATSERKRYLSLSLSPDDQRAALTIQGESRDLWIHHFDRGTLSRLTSSPDTEFDPVWTPDGRRLVYVVDRPPFELHTIDVATPDSGRPLWSERAEQDTTSPAVTPDGTTVAYALSEEATGVNLYARAADGSAPPRVIRASRGDEQYPTFSPDARWVAYQSSETGRMEIYAEAFPGPGERFQLSADGGREPRWARNGDLFYRRDDELRVVTTRRRDGRLEFDAPRTLFSFPILQFSTAGIDSHLYDVTADGQRILAITIPEELRPRQIDVITDWTTELERLVPGASR